MNIKRFYKYILNWLLIIIGLILILWVIWSRFIRERLPKELPLELTEYRLYFLIYLCFIYLYIIKSILIKKEINKSVKEIVETLYLPLKNLDMYIKRNMVILYLTELYLDRKIHKYKTRENLFLKNMKYFYIIFRIVPRFILLFLLYRDVFIIQKIEIFYKYILLGCLPLIARYVKYTIKNGNEIYNIYLEKHLHISDINFVDVKWYHDQVVKNETEEKWNEDYEDEDVEDENNEERIYGKYHEKTLTLQEYIKEEKEEKGFIGYSYFVTTTEEDYKSFMNENFTKEQRERYSYELNNLTKDFSNNVVTKAFLKKSADLQENFRDIDKRKRLLKNIINEYNIFDDFIIIKILKVIIYSLYFIVWFYILLISYKTLKDLSMTLSLIEFIEKHFFEYLEYYLIERYV